MLIPNFLIGGPPKCASTSLYFYLNQHPEIFMSPVKQTRFFSENYDKGIDFYVKTYFSGMRNEKMAGEATPGYFLFPFVAERIHQFNPAMKFIFCLRNPVERAFSGWNMRANNGTEKLSFRDALKENLKQRETIKFITEPTTKEWEETKDHHKVDHTGYRVYIEGSLYAYNLKYYYRFFNPDQVKIIFLDSLKNDFNGTMKSIFSFLGVDDGFIVQNTEQKNTSKTGKVKALGPFLRKVKKLSRSFSGLLPKSAKEKMKDAMFTRSSAEGSKAKLSVEDREFAYKFFEEDIAELEEILKTDLGHWKHVKTGVAKNLPVGN